MGGFYIISTLLIYLKLLLSSFICDFGTGDFPVNVWAE